MFTKVQRGEMTDRLRRFFGIVGPYDSTVDETVSPVATVQNLDSPPFRENGLRFFHAFKASPGAGLGAELVLTPQPGLIAVVDQITLYNSSSNAQRFFVEIIGVPAVGTNNVVIPEQSKLSSGALPQGGIITVNSTPAGPLAPTGIELYDLGLGATSQLILPCEIQVIANFHLRIASEVVAADVRMCVSGRLWTER